MICFNIPLYIVAAFLVLTLVVGLYFSRKKTTFQEYAVGNKQFATATLVATVLATAFGGGSLVREVQATHELGAWWITLSLLEVLGLWTISRLALRMGPFMGHLSMAETLGSIYGKYPRIIAAVVGICTSVVIITGQITVMSKAISICISLVNPFVIPTLATLLLIFYSTFGGIRAITFTDVLQFLTFSVIIPLLAWFMFVKVGKPVAEIVPILQGHTKFQFSNVFHFNTQLASMILLLLSLVAFYITPLYIQRLYMASSPVQAQKVFSYASVFQFVIISFITLIGLFIFVDAPDLPKEAVWSYLITHIPTFFKGFVSISLLAMAMSTADSCLNSCAVMVSHDILESMQRETKAADTHQLKIARWTTLVVGLLSMLLAFRCQDLLELMYWGLDCAVPIIVAPFILAIFGFRGTSCTALIGMATGVFTILSWNKWIQPATEMDGSFLAAVANGLAMMAAHYLLKQPEGAGWVGPDHQFKQIQQENARKRAERKETIKNSWANRKATLTKLVPSDRTLRLTGLYIITTAILRYWFIKPDRICCAIYQVLVGALFTSSKTFFSKVTPAWFISLGWLIGLAIYLPFNLIWGWFHSINPIFTACLSLTHCAVILWVLPLYLAIGVVAIALLGSIYPIATGFPFPVLSSLFPLFIAALLLFAIIICLKVKIRSYTSQILYLKDQEKVRETQKLKASLYDSAMVPAAVGKTKGYGSILAQVIRKIEDSISFLDGSTPLYKQDFQSIINKFYDWVDYFNRREKAKEHALLQPTKISLNKLMRKVELALSQEVTNPPRLLMEKIRGPNKEPCDYIICDINQVTYLLAQAVLQVGKLESAPVVRIQLHPTTLQFKQVDPIDSSNHISIIFQATALVISQATTETLPKVKDRYSDEIDAIGPQSKQSASSFIDLQQETISSIVAAHYGYLEAPVHQQPPTMLLVLPNDITEILSKITAKLPIDCLTLETSVTPKEQADSMMALMQFHDYVCKSSYNKDPIDLKTISGLLLLLRQHFGFKRHASGQLFYVRAVGIAELVVEWVFHSPKVIYAALLYELVRHTCLPLSYVKEHYNLGVYAFVLNVVSIDKRQALDHPSLLYVQNRLKEAIKEEHIQLSVLFIKLAERLYDLRHAAGYIHLTEVHHMAQETLAIDVQLAHTYLDPEIGNALEKAAKEALEVCKQTAKDQDLNRPLAQPISSE
ncbi:MAG: HD domain-containing protein [Candidatus Cardinium sp.]|uniref:sodium:solute symporter family transporter n=1 Tax=Cardinium endosymbiont of Dermatophagoides farinae TaxID=2597823 RepID=UPI0011832066|nr:HD domain-containing protein [Cardinium endosymbiont of Dermatophagoides farinae]TSJ80566.1 HD domain-containing protein [Cardinium endosymbiont of Dermatophagoides farinae]UWW96546.1 MAG: HD domain-containing protein [Candidatus Cardinium sp.]